MLTDPHAESFTQHELRDAMLKTISTLNKWAREANITEYFSSGTTFEEYAPGGHYRMSKRDKRENIILIASEPLTFEQADWMEIPTNTLIVITPKMNMLQIPIIDEFHVSDPLEAKKRGSDFAAQKGLLSSAYGARRGGSVPSPLQPTQDELEAAAHDGAGGEEFPRVEAVNVAAA
ncbi:hypothetical protein FRC01_010348 [Tulasnella sp. 417]|nr:hypothetical protein FRC01_010348 [Tulasnella sp. 417]